MLKKLILISSFVTSALLFLSCSGSNSPTSSAVINDKNLTVSFALPDIYKDSLSKAVAVISGPGIDTMQQQLSIEMARVYGTISNIPLGYKYHIEIKIYNKKDLIIYGGDAFTDVISEKTVDVIIKLSPVSGSVKVIGIIDDEILDTIRHNVSGCWKITQSNGNSGSLQLTQEGTTVLGVSNWSTHSNGPIAGTIVENKLSFTITYPEGVTGYYFATVGSDIQINGPAWSSTLDTVTWNAARIDCVPVSITGCWSINQSNSNRGTLSLTQEGTVIKGVSNWTTHSNGPISGTLINNKLSFTITYPEGVIGYYFATVDSRDTLVGPAWSSTGDTVTWSAKQIECTPPVSIAGCWAINQSNAEIGSIQFTQEGTVIGGISNWTTHSNGPVSGTFIENKLNFTITYPEGVIGYYSATYSDTGSVLINGSAKSSTGDAVAWKAARIVCLKY